jgi:uncharacterized protein (TIGR02246 family)
MRLVVIAIGILIALLATVPTVAAPPEKEPAGQAVGAAQWSSASQSRPEDEKAIRQAVDKFVAAYNAHDASAIAALFTPDGKTADEEGNVSKGRAAIEKLFAGVFKEHPRTRIENAITSIRFVGPAEAVENGTTTVTHDKDTPAEKNRYRVLHVKREGKWQMASATDLPEDAWSGEGQLDQLSGLIGDWVDESPDALVLTTYRWSDNRRFILSQFTVQIAGKPAVTGSQRIGWDPIKKALRSWVFDSEGGFADGLWSGEGNKWTVKLNGATPGGKSASNTLTITLVGKDRLMLQMVDRAVGGEKMPNGEKFLVVRRPPQPQ